MIEADYYDGRSSRRQRVRLLGHVERRHSLRMLVQGSVVGAAMAWWVGDFSTLLDAARDQIRRLRHGTAG